MRKRYFIVAKSKKHDPCNMTNVSWAGGQVDSDNATFTKLEVAISAGRRLAKERGLAFGDIRIGDSYDDLPFETARAFEFSGERRLV